MRFICIDLGDSRTGIAVGDDETKIAHPVRVLDIPIGKLLIDAIVNAIEEHDADELVMGLPLHMDGTSGSRVEITKEFASKLENEIDININYQDERLTSDAAEAVLSRSGKTHKQKKQVRDAIAAAEILKDFLDSTP
ncbi:MAG: Holliday junction resolvase RuvX [Planctomycetota bacterium]|nr:Holliday junction resolvase RuvX [Planctomycetota bacterium]